MPNTSDFNLPYPLLTGDNNPPADLQALAQGVEAGLRNWIKVGTGSVTVTSTAEATGTISFGSTFATAPVGVFPVSTNDLFYVVQVTSITTTGATVRVRHKLGSSVTATVGLVWVAVRN